MLEAAHQQLSRTDIAPIWDNDTNRDVVMKKLIAERDWLTVYYVRRPRRPRTRSKACGQC